MKTIISILITCIFSLVIYAQNEKFHEDIDKTLDQLDKFAGELKKAGKEVKGLSKCKELDEFKKKADDCIKAVKKAEDKVKDAGKDYKDAKKSAEAWGCNNTAELIDKSDKQIKELSKKTDDLADVIRKASNENKIKKATSGLKPFGSKMKEIMSDLKAFKKEIKTINESCK
ncbi:MAG: hypothetical protein ABIJ16_14230 [Bacteroidota bacterium]